MGSVGWHLEGGPRLGWDPFIEGTKPEGCKSAEEQARVHEMILCLSLVHCGAAGGAPGGDVVNHCRATTKKIMAGGVMI